MGGWVGGLPTFFVHGRRRRSVLGVAEGELRLPVHPHLGQGGNESLISCILLDVAVGGGLIGALLLVSGSRSSTYE